MAKIPKSEELVSSSHLVLGTRSGPARMFRRVSVARLPANSHANSSRVPFTTNQRPRFSRRHDGIACGDVVIGRGYVSSAKPRQVRSPRARVLQIEDRAWRIFGHREVPGVAAPTTSVSCGEIVSFLRRNRLGLFGTKFCSCGSVFESEESPCPINILGGSRTIAKVVERRAEGSLLNEGKAGTPALK